MGGREGEERRGEGRRGKARCPPVRQLCGSWAGEGVQRLLPLSEREGEVGIWGRVLDALTWLVGEFGPPPRAPPLPPQWEEPSKGAGNLPGIWKCHRPQSSARTVGTRGAWARTVGTRAPGYGPPAQPSRSRQLRFTGGPPVLPLTPSLRPSRSSGHPPWGLRDKETAVLLARG